VGVDHAKKAWPTQEVNEMGRDPIDRALLPDQPPDEESIEL
jgi:hypothetical protein